jgi:hypothetical protein
MLSIAEPSPLKALARQSHAGIFQVDAPKTAKLKNIANANKLIQLAGSRNDIGYTFLFESSRHVCRCNKYLYECRRTRVKRWAGFQRSQSDI